MSDELEKDPELLDNNDEGTGDDSAYDGEAVDFIEYDHAQFELPDDHEESDDDE